MRAPINFKKNPNNLKEKFENKNLKKDYIKWAYKQHLFSIFIFIFYKIGITLKKGHF